MRLAHYYLAAVIQLQILLEIGTTLFPMTLVDTTKVT